MLSVFRLLWLPTVTSVLNLPGSVKSHAAARKESFFFKKPATECGAFLNTEMFWTVERSAKIDLFFSLLSK